MRARSALFTLFGDVVRPSGGVAWLSVLTRCMESLGFTPQATRTALHRMAGDGWVEPLRSGRFAAYRLTPRGIERLDAAAARIYRLRTEGGREWDGRWRMLHSTAPIRSADSVKSLRWWGYGELDDRLWVSPHRIGRATVDIPAETSMMRFETVPDSDGQRDAEIVRRAWNLAAIHTAHAGFLADWPDAVDHTSDLQEAFATRVRLVHHWRSFLFMDPGLPDALLPSDWLGDAAASRFRALWERHEDAAWHFYDEISLELHDPPALQPPSRDSTPFVSINSAVRTLHPTQTTNQDAAPDASPTAAEAV